MVQGDVILLLVCLFVVGLMVVVGFWLDRFDGDFTELVYFPYKKGKHLVVGLHKHYKKVISSFSGGKPTKKKKNGQQSRRKEEPAAVPSKPEQQQ